MPVEYVTDLLNKVSEKPRWQVVLGAGGMVVVGTILYKMLNRKPKKQWPKDTVILHQIKRVDYDLSLTPFGVKLETYFRMAGIPYINHETGEQSSKKKTPWIEYNGEAVADSSFIIEYLNDKFSIDLNMGLSTTEKAIGRALCKMVDEHTYWTLVLSRWCFDIYDIKPPGFGLFPPWMVWMLPLFRRLVRKQAWAQGVGRHSKDEVYALMEGDLKALSTFLGNNKYLFGDKPCEVDCVVFGQLAEFCWHMPNLYAEQLIHRVFPNLRDYCYRMKKAFWPDLSTDAKSKSSKTSSA